MSSIVPPQNFIMGALALLAQIILSIAIAGVVKTIAFEVTIAWILLCRYLFCLPLLLIGAIAKRGRAFYHVHQQTNLVIRSFVGIIALGFWFLAVQYAGMSLASVLVQTMPIFIVLLAPLLLQEKFGIRRLCAVSIGFIGVIVLAYPDISSLWETGYDHGNIAAMGAIYGISAAFFAAIMFIYIRKLGLSDYPITTALWYNVIGTIVLGSYCTLLTDMPKAFVENLPVLIGIGVVSSLQQFMMAYSHSVASATALTPIHYSAIPLSVAVGIIWFDESLNLTFVIGTALILGATIYIFLREQQLKHKAKKQFSSS